MNLKPLTAALILFTSLVPVLPAADQPAGAPAPASPSQVGNKEKKTDLETQMDKVGKAFRQLRKQVTDPTLNASSLELLSTMEGALKAAVDLTPAKAADLPEDQRAKFIADFKDGIKQMRDQFAKLSAALTANDNSSAAKIVGDIQDLEKREHKEFKKPKPE